ncbi:MAG: phosphate starvation-inducible protein PsiF [Burkholderiales bacterium]|nr:phosphate starvation-inducible protein PsiF [Burkholderiales bacterium]
MKSFVIAACALLLATGHDAFAAEGPGAKPQTTRMSQCSADAKDRGLKGDARKEYMSECLRNPAARTAAKECGSAAAEKGLTGKERKEFVSDCVKSKMSAG